MGKRGGGKAHVGARAGELPAGGSGGSSPRAVAQSSAGREREQRLQNRGSKRSGTPVAAAAERSSDKKAKLGRKGESPSPDVHQQAEPEPQQQLQPQEGLPAPAPGQAVGGDAGRADGADAGMVVEGEPNERQHQQQVQPVQQLQPFLAPVVPRAGNAAEQATCGSNVEALAAAAAPAAGATGVSNMEVLAAAGAAGAAAPAAAPAKAAAAAPGPAGAAAVKHRVQPVRAVASGARTDEHEVLEIDQTDDGDPKPAMFQGARERDANYQPSGDGDGDGDGESTNSADLQHSADLELDAALSKKKPAARAKGGKDSQPEGGVEAVPVRQLSEEDTQQVARIEQLQEQAMQLAGVAVPKDTPSDNALGKLFTPVLGAKLKAQWRRAHQFLALRAEFTRGGDTKEAPPWLAETYEVMEELCRALSVHTIAAPLALAAKVKQWEEATVDAAVAWLLARGALVTPAVAALFDKASSAAVKAYKDLAGKMERKIKDIKTAPPPPSATKSRKSTGSGSFSPASPVSVRSAWAARAGGAGSSTDLKFNVLAEQVQDLKGLLRQLLQRDEKKSRSRGAGDASGEPSGTGGEPSSRTGG